MATCVPAHHSSLYHHCLSSTGTQSSPPLHIHHTVCRHVCTVIPSQVWAPSQVMFAVISIQPLFVRCWDPVESGHPAHTPYCLQSSLQTSETATVTEGRTWRQLRQCAYQGMQVLQQNPFCCSTNSARHVQGAHSLEATLLAADALNTYMPCSTCLC